VEAAVRRYALVLSTAGSEEVALRIARALVEGRLAACVNVLPGSRSVYRWAGRLAEEREWLLLVKTAEDLLASVRQTIRQLHDYELPEVLVLPIGGGDEAYLAWLEQSLEPRP
jgi:periplasmic divalent cation tolerance protein